MNSLTVELLSHFAHHILIYLLTFLTYFRYGFVSSITAQNYNTLFIMYFFKVANRHKNHVKVVPAELRAYC